LTDVLIVAPQFLVEDDLPALDVREALPFWKGGWRQGDRSRSTDGHPRAAVISSFAVVDAMLRRLGDRAAYPNLESVVVAGHSAGGQFANRFAAGSRVEPELRAAGIDVVRYVVANPSSYVYLSGKRRVRGTVDRFAKPSTTCSGYDRYKFGLKDLNRYMAAVGAPAIRSQYGARHVRYLLGALDDDPAAEGLATSCESMLQGCHRLQRGTIYFNHIGDELGSSVYVTHKKRVVPGVAHDSFGMFGSVAGRAALFGVHPLDGSTQPPTHTEPARLRSGPGASACFPPRGDEPERPRHEP
jgi:hypothetical protein